MRVVRLFILFVVLALSGCGGQASSLPTQSPTVPSASVVAPVPPLIITSLPIYTPELSPTLGAGDVSTSGVYGNFTTLTPVAGLTDTFALEFDLQFHYTPPVTSTVMITLSYAGNLQGLDAPTRTLIVADDTVITTTVRITDLGQGEVYAQVTFVTLQNPHNNSDCTVLIGYDRYYRLLVTDLGILIDNGGYEMYDRYLETARQQGVITEEEYQYRFHILSTATGGLIVNLHGIPQTLSPLPNRPPFGIERTCVSP